MVSRVHGELEEGGSEERFELTLLFLSQGSSSGRLPHSFLEDVFTAAQDFPPHARHITKNAHLLAPFDPAKIKVVYPSENDIRNSPDGASVRDSPPADTTRS
jgi:hypothetical protein